jgi:2-methylcitrate dehydratase PrpD
VIEGPFGYLPLFEQGWDLTPVIADLGRVWRITQVSWKPFPTGRAAQGGIPAVQALMRDGVTADNLASLTLTAPPLIKRLVGRPIVSPLPPNYARLCFQYLGAVTLLRGTVGLGDFTVDRLNDPATHALAAKITVIDDGGRPVRLAGRPAFRGPTSGEVPRLPRVRLRP